MKRKYPNQYLVVPTPELGDPLPEDWIDHSYDRALAYNKARHYDRKYGIHCEVVTVSEYYKVKGGKDNERSGSN